MKKLKLKKKHAYQIILFGALAGSVLLAFFCYGLSYRRLSDGAKDLFYSFWYYFEEFVNSDTNDVVATVTQLPDIKLEEILPWDWVAIERKFALLFPSLFTKEYFMAYLQRLGNFAKDGTYYLMILIPVILAFGVLVRRLIDQTSDRPNGAETKPLRLFKKLTKKPFIYAREWIGGFVEYLRSNRWMKVLMWIWIFNLNIVSIVLEFVAFYVYFAAAFDLGNVFVQILKLFVDVVIITRQIA